MSKAKKQDLFVNFWKKKKFNLSGRVTKRNYPITAVPKSLANYSQNCEKQVA